MDIKSKRAQGAATKLTGGGGEGGKGGEGESNFVFTKIELEALIAAITPDNSDSSGLDDSESEGIDEEASAPLLPSEFYIHKILDMDVELGTYKVEWDSGDPSSRSITEEFASNVDPLGKKVLKFKKKFNELRKEEEGGAGSKYVQWLETRKEGELRLSQVFCITCNRVASKEYQAKNFKWTHNVTTSKEKPDGAPLITHLLHIFDMTEGNFAESLALHCFCSPCASSIIAHFQKPLSHSLKNEVFKKIEPSSLFGRAIEKKRAAVFKHQPASRSSSSSKRGRKRKAPHHRSSSSTKREKKIEVRKGVEQGTKKLAAAAIEEGGREGKEEDMKKNVEESQRQSPKRGTKRKPPHPCSSSSSKNVKMTEVREEEKQGTKKPSAAAIGEGGREGKEEDMEKNVKESQRQSPKRGTKRKPPHPRSSSSSKCVKMTEVREEEKQGTKKPSAAAIGEGGREENEKEIEKSKKKEETQNLLPKRGIKDIELSYDIVCSALIKNAMRAKEIEKQGIPSSATGRERGRVDKKEAEMEKIKKDEETQSLSPKREIKEKKISTSTLVSVLVDQEIKVEETKNEGASSTATGDKRSREEKEEKTETLILDSATQTEPLLDEKFKIEVQNLCQAIKTISESFLHYLSNI